jgi:hypothetical protein
MMDLIFKQPSFKEDVDPGSIGFYEFQKMKRCYWGGIAIGKILSEGKLHAQRGTKSLIVGNFYHNVLEKAHRVSTKDELMTYANDLIRDIETKNSDLIIENKLGRVQAWSEITNTIRSALDIIRKRDPQTSDCESSNKLPKMLTSRNGYFKGIPDFYRVIDENAILVEYKSAEVFREDGAKKEYVEQLHFYSVLIYETFPKVKKINAQLVSLSGANYSLELEESAILKFMEKFNYEYEHLGARKEILNYSDEYCVNCEKRFFCKVFLENISNRESKNDIFTIVGEFTGKKVINNSEYEYYFSTHTLKRKGEPINFLDGQEYTICNVFKVKGKYIWSSNSFIYEKN